MKAIILSVFTILLLIAPNSAPAQSNDLAAERARLAEQRIQVDAARREREERERLGKVEADNQTETDTSAASIDERPGLTDLSRTLEQIRKLGELWDAGYLTDTEFQQIKARILNDES